MNTMYYHYSPEGQINLKRSYTQSVRHSPQALWLSTEGGYGSWRDCIAGVAPDLFTYKWRFKVKEDGILYLRTIKDYRKFKEYYLDRYYVDKELFPYDLALFDWSKVTQDYKGVYVSETLSNDETALAAWECITLAIWDLSLVVSYESLTHSAQHTKWLDQLYEGYRKSIFG